MALTTLDLALATLASSSATPTTRRSLPRYKGRQIDNTDLLDSIDQDDIVQTTYSDHLPHRNDDRREEQRRDDRDRRHDDSSESSSTGQLRQRQPDNAIRRRPDVLSQAKSRFNIFLNILQSSYIAIMFLRAVFSMFALKMIFFHVYHLKDDIQLSLR